METSDDTPLEAPSDLEDKSAFNFPRFATNRLSWMIPQKLRGPSFNLGGTSPTTQKRGPPGNIAPKSCEHSPDHSEAAAASVPSETVDMRQNKPTTKNITNRLSLKFSGGKRLTPCPRCQQLQESIDSLEAELNIKDREVKDRDEINEFLRSEIRMTEMKAKVSRDLADVQTTQPSDSKIDVLVQREQTIEQLQRLLEDAINEKDRVTTELDAKRKELEALGEQVSLFKEAICAKDHVVVDLTNKLFQLEHNGQIPNDPKDVMLPSTTQTLEEELTRAQEAVEAYKRQNQFLSSEILELNNVRTEDLESYRITSSKYHELEANFFKIQSKYMILLQESQTPRMGSDTGPSPELVSQMLEEALQTDDKHTSKERSLSFDQYGFSQGQTALDQGQVADPLVMRARKLDQQAQVIKDTMASTTVKWENYFTTHGEPTRSYELKSLIRAGVPRVYRTKVWQWMVRDTVGKKFVDGQYQAILQQHAGQTSVAVNQIELDLLRTLPTNKYYDKPDAQGINKLRRVLVAFSWYDSNVGYCQGLNRLAAIALLFLEEEDAFWCLVAIVHHLLPQDYYSKTLLGSQTDQRVLREVLQEKAPKLNTHLGTCNIDFSLITFNWFHTIYVDNLPVETMLRIWDTFLYEGSKVLFRFAIAIFKFNEEELLACGTSIGIFNKLRTLCQNATNIDRLVQIAFFELNPFPMKKINTHRAYHRQIIKEELDALDVLRSQAPPIAPPTRETREQSKDDDSDVEETIFF